MVRTKYILYILLLFFSLFPARICASEIYPVPQEVINSDSIMNRIMLFTPFYERIIEEYHAHLYVKGNIHAKKRNWLLKSVPAMIKMERDVKDYIIETVSDIHFTAPNIYDQKITAISTTVSRNKGLSSQIMEYFSMNIYAPALLKNKILSPLAPSNRKFYTYVVDSLCGPPDQRIYHIAFIPRNWSRQLVKGWMTVSDQTWSVREIHFEGNPEQTKFAVDVIMGKEGAEDEFLPVNYSADIAFNFMGNKIDGSYYAQLDYSSVKLNETRRRFKRKKRYDLTDSYALQCDTNAFTRDTTYFATLRPTPLTAHEDSVYRNHYARRDSSNTAVKFKSQGKVFWGEVSDFLIQNYTINLPNVGDIRCSPLINPFLIDYSHRNGLSYKQEFKYNRVLPGDRLLRIVPRIGYNFTRKEFYWRVRADFDYWPAKRAGVHLDIGNGNRIYNSTVMEELKNMPDSIFDFNKLQLDYFNDFYIKFRHSYEITNGLTFNVGFTGHRRTPIHKVSDIIDPDDIPPVVDPVEEIQDKIRDVYQSFAPNVSLIWTPGQFYYRDGHRKINLRSKYPTFTVDYERAIKGAFNSNNGYEKWEFDMQHQIKVSLMKTIYYRVGGGFFTNQESIYFVDFNNFARSNLPRGWNDDIGGTFQLLDRRWFNASRKYVRANFTYEAPFLLLRHLGKHTSYVQNERFYVSALRAPHLNPYLEFGYGIGTHVFDLGVFVSNMNGKFHEFGAKFTFELFTK